MKGARIAILSATLLLSLLVGVSCGTAASTATPTPLATQVPTTTAPGGPGEPTSTPDIAPDFDAAEYFRGKTVRVSVSSSPGGGNDTHARIMSAPLSKHIPGNPRVIVTNIDGIGGRNYIYNAPADGYNIGISAHPGIADMVNPGATFDARDATYFAKITDRTLAWMITDQVPYTHETFQDLIDGTGPPLRLAEEVASRGDVAGTTLETLLLCDLFNMPCQIFTVHDASTGQALLMVDRGEVNTIVKGNVWWQMPSLRPGEAAAGRFKGLVTSGHPDLRLPPHTEVDYDPPNVYHFMNEEQKRQWEIATFPGGVSQRIYWGPPRVPDHIVQVLTQAIEDAHFDPTVRPAVERLTGDLSISFAPHHEIQPRVHAAARTYMENVDELDRMQERLFLRYIVR